MASISEEEGPSGEGSVEQKKEAPSLPPFDKAHILKYLREVSE